MRWTLLALALLVACGPAAPPEPPPQPVAQMRADLDYGPDQQQKLDMYLPGGSRTRPLLLLVHGGAWVSGDRRSLQKHARALAERGVAVAAVGYRLSRGGTMTDNTTVAGDVATAIAWLRMQARRMRIDPAKIYVAGHSAGAHAAGLLATDPGYLEAAGLTQEAVAGYIGIEGIYDIPALVERWPHYRQLFVLTAFGESEQTWRDCSPALRTPVGRVKWLLIHSSEDELVDLPQTTRFAAHLRAARVPVTALDPGTLAESHFGVLRGLIEPGPMQKAVLDFVGD